MPCAAASQSRKTKSSATTQPLAAIWGALLTSTSPSQWGTRERRRLCKGKHLGWARASPFAVQPRISVTAIAEIASFTSQPAAQDAAIAGASFSHNALTMVNGNGPINQIAAANLRVPRQE